MSIKVKICGITRLEDAVLALSLGADELGFVLAPSARRMEPEAAKSILDGLKAEGAPRAFRAVGVFVNEGADAMRDIIAFAGLDVAQIHGDESVEACAAFDFPWYRALRIGSVADAHGLVEAGWDCPRLLVDSASRGSYGGTGASIATWAAIASGVLARERGKEFFVAGGVRPENVASFIHSLSPDGLDVSSGVEEAPGRKSRERLEALFRGIRAAEADAGGAKAAGKEAEHAAR
jgi:phosphoribosylanthranilate isomerase